MFDGIRRFYAAAPHRPRLTEREVQRLYPRYRWQIMEATFLGYSMFYLVRNNLAVVALDVENALGYSHDMIGSLLAITAITYGLGKFVMGAVSDRCNARVFMATGLGLTSICNFAFGSISSYPLHLALWGLNGFIQGMGWPPCGRAMGHWYSKRERGLSFSLWNSSTNVGGGLAGYIAGWAAHEFGGWRAAFYFPGALTAIGAIYLLVRLRDTPQSVGLPPIEEYKNDYTAPPAVQAAGERELTYRELLVTYVLCNRYVWLVAVANLFAYVSRYSMLDWGPTYLREMKGASLKGGGLAVLVLEFGGIGSTILLGWFSDRLGGRRGLVATLGMLPVLGAFAAMLLTPAGHLWLDMALLSMVGLFIYPVINLIQIMALDCAGKKAVGTAAGFIGLFGYTGRSLQAKGFGWMLDHFGGLYGQERAWQLVIACILACTALSMVLLAFTWKMGSAVQTRGFEVIPGGTEADLKAAPAAVDD